MRICYVGNFQRSWHTESHVARDAEALGHTVDRIPEPTRVRELAELERRAEGADLLLYTKTHGVPPEATALWRRLEANGTQTASFHLDLYVGLARQRTIGGPFWQTGTVFTADGDPQTTEWLADIGIRHRWMPAAVVSDEAIPGSWRAEYDHDVVFVGSTGYHPEWPWRTELLQRLDRRYGLRFRIYNQPPVRDLDLNDLYATARVVVGDSLALPGHSFYWSDRFYEVVGRGGFLIGPHVAGIDDHFDDGEHLRLYEPGNFDMVARLVDYYLDHPDKARMIANTGQAYVRANHTYKHRVAAMLEALQLCAA